MGRVKENGQRRAAPRWRCGAVAAVVLGAASLAACGGGGGSKTITLYNGQHPQLTQALVSAFEKQTGIHVNVRTDDGIVLADQILQEGSHSPADVYLTENSPELMLLSEHHLLAGLPTSTTGQVPARYNSPTGNWVAVALRVSALSYNPSLVPASKLPASVMDLARPEWKGKLAIAPTDSDFVPLVGAVIATYGQPAALNWLRGLKSNAASYQDIESVVAAVERRQKAIGIINQYYWYRLQLEQGGTKTQSKLYFFPNKDVGGIENISGAAVLASSHKQAAAQEFVAFLVSAAAQRILEAGDDYEYPARPGIAANPALLPLASAAPAVIDVVALGDDLAAAKLIQQAGLT